MTLDLSIRKATPVEIETLAELKDLGPEPFAKDFNADYLWRKQGGPAQTPTLDDVLIGVPPAEPIPMPQRASPALPVEAAVRVVDGAPTVIR